MAEPIKIVEELRKGVYILRVKSPILLEPSAADEMTKRLSDLFETGAQKVIIDMGMVNRTSSLFFRSFIIAGKKAVQNNAKMAFCHISPAIKAGFEMMKMDSFFKIYPDETKAMENI